MYAFQYDNHIRKPYNDFLQTKIGRRHPTAAVSHDCTCVNTCTAGRDGGARGVPPARGRSHATHSVAAPGMLMGQASGCRRLHQLVSHLTFATDDGAVQQSVRHNYYNHTLVCHAGWTAWLAKQLHATGMCTERTLLLTKPRSWMRSGTASGRQCTS